MNSTHAVAKPPADTYRIVRKRVAHLKPSPENEQLYLPVDPSDPEIIALAESIKREGLHEPLVITADRYIVSGHRRHTALRLAGQKQAPCRVLAVKRKDLTRDQYVAMLRDHNRQRTKSAAEAMREAIVDVDLEQAISNLNVRRRSSLERYLENGVGEFRLDGTKKRHGIRMAEKGDHVELIKSVVLEELRKYWPLDNRRVHYALLNHSFYRNTREKLRYQNDGLSYDATNDLLTRLRLRAKSRGKPWRTSRVLRKSIERSPMCASSLHSKEASS
jgi:hypothetical protein